MARYGVLSSTWLLADRQDRAEGTRCLHDVIVVSGRHNVGCRIVGVKSLIGGWWSG